MKIFEEKCEIIMLPTGKKETVAGKLCLNENYLFSARESSNVGGLRGIGLKI